MSDAEEKEERELDRAPSDSESETLFQGPPGAAPRSSPPLPEWIGTYRVERRLGHGGMGEIFLAWDDRLQRQVAIKRIRHGSEHPDTWQERFRREARAAACLSHSAIVQIYELVTDDQGDAIVMEYVKGATLAERLAKGPLPPAEAVRLARHIAEGLAAAHQAGLVHRDLKAENVIVTPGGQAKILDFGLARPVAQTESDVLTQQGILLGTFHAMSPEQAGGGEIDERSDLFSLGALLYEMISGRAPFRGANPLDTLKKVLTVQPPPLFEANHDLPEGNNIVDSPESLCENSLCGYTPPRCGWREWLDAVGSGLSPRRRATHALAMLTSYMDDSGSSQGPVFVLAGYVAPVDVWRSFSAAWEETLAAPPTLPYLKANHAHMLKETFLGWSAAERDSKLAALADVICHQPIITALVFCLPWDDFLRARDEHPEVVGFHPYDLLFHQVMSNTTGLFVESKISETIEYVFDEQGVAGERAIMTYRQIRDILPERQTGLIVGSPRMEDDKLVLPLQAADLLAWNVRRYAAKHGGFPYRRGGRFPLPDAPLLTQLLKIEYVYVGLNYASVKEILSAMTKPWREVFADSDAWTKRWRDALKDEDDE